MHAPLQKLEHALHGWVQFGVMPVFALANAGVALSLGTVAGEAVPVALGIVVGLVVGKPIGILLAASGGAACLAGDEVFVFATRRTAPETQAWCVDALGRGRLGARGAPTGRDRRPDRG